MVRALLPILLLGCAGSPSPAPSWDLFHRVYLRGQLDGSGRVALSFEGPNSCTPAILEALHKEELNATFFLDPDKPLSKESFKRLQGEGQALALLIKELPEAPDEAWFKAQRRRLEARFEGIEGLRLEPFWRLHNPNVEALRRAQSLAAPLLLWSLKLPQGDLEEMLSAGRRRWGDGEIIAFPDGGADCSTLPLITQLKGALAAEGLRVVPLPELLSPSLERHSSIRLIRLRQGIKLSSSCREALSFPPKEAYWGMVDHISPEGIRFLPLVAPPSTAALLEQAEALEVLWEQRRRWRALPACLRQVSMEALHSPFSPQGPQGRVHWWVAGPELQSRDPRALAAPGEALILPALADLVRLESQQRLPRRLRGLVAGALSRLGLEAPFLVELRESAALVLSQPLSPELLRRSDALAQVQRAIGGYSAFLAASLGEYLFLAALEPQQAKLLQRMARAAEGFLHPGPFLVLAREGRGPIPDRLRLGRRPAFAEPPERLVMRVLRAGISLRPGDIIASPAPAVQPPSGALDRSAVTRRAALRGGLARSILHNLESLSYLRPGDGLALEAGLLGRQRLRLAVPPGIAVPSPEARPLVEQASGGGL